MEFEWDAQKAEINEKRHGISFEYAAQIFLDPLRIEFEDNRTNYGEVRKISIGLIDGELIVLVVFVEREKIRIISARKAVKHERRQYNNLQVGR